MANLVWLLLAIAAIVLGGVYIIAPAAQQQQVYLNQQRAIWYEGCRTDHKEYECDILWAKLMRGE